MHISVYLKSHKEFLFLSNDDIYIVHNFRAFRECTIELHSIIQQHSKITLLLPSCYRMYQKPNSNSAICILSANFLRHDYFSKMRLFFP